MIVNPTCGAKPEDASTFTQVNQMTDLKINLTNVNENCFDYSPACATELIEFQAFYFESHSNFRINNSKGDIRLRDAYGGLNERTAEVNNYAFNSGSFNFQIFTGEFNFISIQYENLDSAVMGLEMSDLNNAGQLFGKKCISPYISRSIIENDIANFFKIINSANLADGVVYEVFNITEEKTFNIQIQFFDHLDTKLEQIVLNSGAAVAASQKGYVHFKLPTGATKLNLMVRNTNYVVENTESKAYLYYYKSGIVNITPTETFSVELNISKYDEGCLSEAGSEFEMKENCNLGYKDEVNCVIFCIDIHKQGDTSIKLQTEEIEIWSEENITDPCTGPVSQAREDFPSGNIYVRKDVDSGKLAVLVYNIDKTGRYKLKSIETTRDITITSNPVKIAISSQYRHFKQNQQKSIQFHLKGFNDTFSAEKIISLEHRLKGSEDPFTAVATATAGGSTSFAGCYQSSLTFPTKGIYTVKILIDGALLADADFLVMVEEGNTCDSHHIIDLDIFECVPSCSKYLHDNIFCSDRCDGHCGVLNSSTCSTLGLKRDNTQCLADCSTSATGNTKTYNDYLCVSTCDNLKADDGLPAYTYLDGCMTNCADKKTILETRTCTDDCSLHTYPGTSTPYNYYNTDNICTTTCSAYLKGSLCVDDCCRGETLPCSLIYVDESNQCTSTCELATKFILDGKKCVSACPNNEYDPANRQCLAGCANFRQGNSCVDECPHKILPQKADTLQGSFCLVECPSAFPFDRDNICVSSCWPFYGENKTCLNECSSFCLTSPNKMDCLAECPESSRFYIKKKLKICVTTPKPGNYTIKHGGIEYSVPIKCQDILLNQKDSLDCPSLCNDNSATTLEIDTKECLSTCPPDKPYISSRECVSSCSEFYTLFNECLPECNKDYPLLQIIENKNFCLDQCIDGAVKNHSNYCYFDEEIKCDYPNVKFYNMCLPCGKTDFWEEGSCVKKCSDGFISVGQKCTKCSKLIFENKCLDSCPDGLFLSESPVPCLTCEQRGWLIEENECVSECSLGYVKNKDTCQKCTSGSKECEKCPNNFLLEDNSCSKTCTQFSFKQGNQLFCLSCLGKYFFKDRCVSECPSNSILYRKGQECLETSNSCLKSNCQRQSTCYERNGLAECHCREGTAGLLCQAKTDQIAFEIEINPIQNWKSVSDFSLIQFRNIKKLLKNSVDDADLRILDSIFSSYSVLDSNLLEIADSLIASKDLEVASKYYLKLINLSQTPKRFLSALPSLEFTGDNIELVVSQSIAEKVNISSCESKIREQLQIPSKTALTYRLFQLNIETPLEPPSKAIKLTSSPRITVELFLDGSKLESSVSCATEDINVSFSSEPSVTGLQSLVDKGANPFDASDPFFVDICSLKNNAFDTTLSRRVEDFYVSPAEQCNQQEGHICSVSVVSVESVKCNCVGLNNNPGDLTTSWVYWLTSSNMQMVKCADKVTGGDTFRNIGFLTSVVVFLVFHILQLLSTWLTIRKLNSSRIWIFLRNSASVLDLTKMTVSSYFELIKNKVVEINDKGLNPTRMSSAKEFKELELDLLTLKAPYLRKFCPTIHDFDGLSQNHTKIYDKRSFTRVFWDFNNLLHSYWNAFFYDSLLIPQNFRLFYLMTNILMTMSLNALFYTDSYINSRSDAKDTVNS